MRCEVDGRWLLNFCSNDYLGLSQQFAVVNALQDGAAREGVGSTASHLVCGQHAVHDELERELAEWNGAPRALLFGSGFPANLDRKSTRLHSSHQCPPRMPSFDCKKKKQL